MSEQVLLVDFFKAIEEDPRVNSRHVSLYASLFQFWINKENKSRLELFSNEVMGLCKISASSTYHKTIRELHAFGYIIYDPSFNPHQRSRISLTKLKNHEKKYGH
jgi:replication initiation and membrane attachment protein DnaB